MENEKDTTLTAITSGSKYFSNVRFTAPSHTQTLSNPFQNLTNKVSGKIFYKEVFLRLSVCIVYSCVFIIRRLNYYCIGMYPAHICIFLYESADDYITLIAKHTWKDTSQQQRNTQLRVVKESTTMFQHTTN